MDLTPSFWAGKKVFVTGHTGFKGSWLCEILLQWGAKVTGYALAPKTQPNLFTLFDLENRLEHIIGDLRDFEHLKQTMVAAQPEIILHLGAQPLVRLSYEDPMETFATNVMGTVHVLEAARALPCVKSILIVTSDKCYRNDDRGIPFVEEDALGGKDPYSGSKACADIIAQSYFDSFFKARSVAMATARAGNVIGGGDWAKDRIVPDAVRAFTEGRPVVIRNPLATRPWQHVLEPLRGYLLLAQKLYTDGNSFAGGWNFGPSENGVQSVSYILSLLKNTLSFEVEADNSIQPYEAKALGLSIDKAEKELGWIPQMDLKTAVDWTGSWYRALAEGEDIKNFSCEQIKTYFSQNEFKKLQSRAV